MQLTTHNGQIQASLRCERGSLAGLDGHWNDLQESLAKQNVQLLPPADSASVRATVSSTPSTAGGSMNFNQSPSNRRVKPRDFAGCAHDDRIAAKPVRNAKTQNQTRSRQGWESWA